MNDQPTIGKIEQLTTNDDNIPDVLAIKIPRKTLDTLVSIKEVDRLRAEVARLQTENATIDRRYHEFLRDWADMDTHVRNAAKTVLAAPAVDGNSYGVPAIEDVADMLVAKVARLREALAIAEAEGRQAFIDENERHMETREEVKRLREVLEDAFDYVLELSALKRGDAQLDRYCTDLAQFLDKDMGITNETDTTV